MARKDLPGARPPRGTRALRRVSEESPALACYFAEIRRLPVLGPEQEAAFAKQMREARVALRDELGRVPWCAGRLVEAWRERRGQGRIASSLCEDRPSEERAEDWVDAKLGDAARLLEGRGGRPSAASRRLDERIAALFGEIDPRTDLLLGWLGELEVREGARRRDPELGVPRRRLGEILGRARIQRRHYREAKDALVSHNLRLVVHMAKDFRHLELPFGDLIQEGNLGLIRAVEKFDERRGARLTTYASWWIAQGFIRAHQKHARTVRVPAHVYQRLMDLRRLELEFERTAQRPPTAGEIGARLELPAAEVQALLRARMRIDSLDEPDEDGETKRAGQLADPQVADPAERHDAECLSEQVNGLLDVLDERERHIVTGRFGLAGGEERTLQDLGDELAISRERVRQLEKRALGKLAQRAAPSLKEEHLT